MFANCRVPISPCCPSWIKSENCSSLLCQPLPILKESGGLNLTEWYSPGRRILEVGYSGRGRALASAWPPVPPQALSASTNPTTTSTATTMGAADKRLLRLIRHPPFVKGTKRGVRAGSRCPCLRISCTILPEEGAAHRTDV